LLLIFVLLIEWCRRRCSLHRAGAAREASSCSRSSR